MYFNKGKKSISFPNQWKLFPRVGNSPSRTPEHSSTDVSPRDNKINEIKKDESENQISILDNSHKIKKFETQKKDFLEKRSPNIKINESINLNNENYKESKIKLDNVIKKEINKETYILPLSTGQFSRSALVLKNNRNDNGSYKQKNEGTLFEKKSRINRSKESIRKRELCNRKKFSNQTIKNPSRLAKYIGKQSSNLESNSPISINYKNCLETNKDKISLDNNIRDSNQELQKIDKIQKQDLSATVNLKQYFRDQNLSESFPFYNNELIGVPDEQKKTKDLFSYIYLNSSLPRRISAGIYKIDKDKKISEDEIFNYEKYLNRMSDLNNEFKQYYNEINIPYFKKWIIDYKFKKEKLNLRIESAKYNRDNFKSIEKNKSLISVNKENTVTENIFKKNEKLDNLAKGRKSNEKLNDLNFKDPHFTSKLEMDEILKQVNYNLVYRKKSAGFLKIDQKINNYKRNEIISNEKTTKYSFLNSNSFSNDKSKSKNSKWIPTLNTRSASSIQTKNEYPEI